MEQKGIGYCDTDDMAEGQTGPLFWLSEDAINAYFDLKKNSKQRPSRSSMILPMFTTIVTPMALPVTTREVYREWSNLFRVF